MLTKRGGMISFQWRAWTAELGVMGPRIGESTVPAIKDRPKGQNRRRPRKVVPLLEGLPAGLRSKVRSAFSHLAKEMVRPPKHRG